MICYLKATAWLNKHLRVITIRRSLRSMTFYSQTITNLSQRMKESTLTNSALSASSIGSTLTSTLSLNGKSKINTNQSSTPTSLNLKRQLQQSMISKQNESTHAKNSSSRWNLEMTKKQKKKLASWLIKRATNLCSLTTLKIALATLSPTSITWWITSTKSIRTSPLVKFKKLWMLLSRPNLHSRWVT